MFRSFLEYVELKTTDGAFPLGADRAGLQLPLHPVYQARRLGSSFHLTCVCFQNSRLLVSRCDSTAEKKKAAGTHQCGAGRHNTGTEFLCVDWYRRQHARAAMCFVFHGLFFLRCDTSVEVFAACMYSLELGHKSTSCPREQTEFLRIVETRHVAAGSIKSTNHRA